MMVISLDIKELEKMRKQREGFHGGSIQTDKDIVYSAVGLQLSQHGRALSKLRLELKGLEK